LLNPDKVKLGIAPIGWTNDDLPELGGDIPFERCIREMAEAGYAGTEVGSKFPKDAKRLLNALAPLGLRVAGQWFSAQFTVRPAQETVDRFVQQMEFLRSLGAEVIVVSEQGNSIQGELSVPLFQNKPRLDEQGWTLLARGLDTLGALAAERGMTVVVHPHMGTVIQTKEEVDRLMDATDEEKVYLLLDTGHAYCAGDDPPVLAREHARRIRHVHLKDVREEVKRRVEEEGLSFLEGVKEGLFTVPGDGAVDFLPVLKVLDEAAYEGWIIVEAEQDPSLAPPLAYAKKARRFLRERTGL